MSVCIYVGMPFVRFVEKSTNNNKKWETKKNTMNDDNVDKVQHKIDYEYRMRCGKIEAEAETETVTIVAAATTIIQ